MRSLNDDDSLWTHLDIDGTGGSFIRKYRSTACPVMGDDDVDDVDDEDETSDDGQSG